MKLNLESTYCRINSRELLNLVQLCSAGIDSKLTVSGDVNGLFLCHSPFQTIRTGQVLPLMKGQRKLISQPGFDDTALML